MEIRKTAALSAEEAVTGEELAEIARFTQRPLGAEEVYTFALRLCDNEVDRDYERFSEASLRRLGELFVGKSGIFDHQWSARGQTARLYRTAVVPEEGVTAAGERRCWLKGWAYMLRTEENAPLIAEIEGGIKKEISIGCSVGRRVCSVCGSDGPCGHVPGQIYDGRLCFRSLEDPADAYEWSFVAVPAQREAGVVRKEHRPGELKALVAAAGGEDCRRQLAQLEKEAALGRSYLEGLRQEAVRLSRYYQQVADDIVWYGQENERIAASRSPSRS